jgi:group I intron endonuclease
MMNQSGIYEIINTVNGKRYIGSTVSFKTRWRTHRRELKGAKHHSAPLQRAWNKYGEAAFKFLPILVCQKSMLLFYEQQLLDKVKPEYNIALSASAPMMGAKFTPQHRARIGDAHRGKTVSAETRARLSALRKGVALSAEAIAKMRASQKGRVHSEAHLARQREAIIEYHKNRPKKSEADQKQKKADAQRRRRAAKRGVAVGAPYVVSQETRDKRSAALKGRVFSDAHRAKISAGLIGRTLSAEARRKIGEASRGRGHSEEARRKISAGASGKRHSEETKAKMSASRKAYLAAKRERERAAA